MAQDNYNVFTATRVVESPLEFLDADFLHAMNDIGRYGHEKYGENSFHHRALQGDRSRGTILERTSSEAILRHSNDHNNAYLAGERHDKFGTLKHQLAAAAFNSMMEFYFAGLERE